MGALFIPLYRSVVSTVSQWQRHIPSVSYFFILTPSSLPSKEAVEGIWSPFLGEGWRRRHCLLSASWAAPVDLRAHGQQGHSRRETQKKAHLGSHVWRQPFVKGSSDQRGNLYTLSWILCERASPSDVIPSITLRDRDYQDRFTDEKTDSERERALPKGYTASEGQCWNPNLSLCEDFRVSIWVWVSATLSTA